MLFVNIEIENFFAIKEKISIPLKNQGLVLLKGINKDSKTSSSNGAGKSTIIEAMVWCLFGKTIRERINDEVINRWVKKNCMVRLYIEDNDTLFCVERYRKHKQHKNNLYFFSYQNKQRVDISKGTPTLTQEEVHKFLGIDLDTFIQGPMLPQGSIKRISQMTDSEQKAVLDTATQLSKLSEAHDRAKAKLGELRLDVDKKHTEALDKQNQQALIENQISFVNSQIKEQKEKNDKAKLKQLIKITMAEADLESEWDDLIIPTENTEELSTVRQRFMERKNEAIKEYTAQKKQFEDVLVELRVQTRDLKEKRAYHKHEIMKIDDLDGADCPTCHQLVPSDHVQDRKDACEHFLTLIKKDLKDKLKETDIIQVGTYKLEDLHNKKIQKLDQLIEQTRVRETQALTQRANFDNCIQQIEFFENHVRTLRQEDITIQEDSSLSNKLKELKETYDKLENDIVILSSDIDDLENEIEHVEFWIEGFSNTGVKSLVLQSITPFLNKQAKRNSQFLTGGDIDIQFSTQKQLKNGKIKEQFNVTVENTHGADNYKGNSDGEKGRADLAISLAFSDLVASRARKAYPQRWYDEPFEHLDDAGVEAVMELLSELVKSCGTIFVVTHHPQLQSLFQKTLTFVKENGVTTLQ